MNQYTISKKRLNIKGDYEKQNYNPNTSPLEAGVFSSFVFFQLRIGRSVDCSFTIHNKESVSCGSMASSLKTRRRASVRYRTVFTTVGQCTRGFGSTNSLTTSGGQYFDSRTTSIAGGVLRRGWTWKVHREQKSSARQYSKVARRAIFRQDTFDPQSFVAKELEIGRATRLNS